MTWSERVMLYISRSVSSSLNTSMAFYCSSLSLSKVVADKLLVTFHDMKWPWRHDEESLVTIFRFGVLNIPVNHRCLRVFRMFFVQKRCLSIFPLTYNGEVAKLTWPWVSDIKIPRYKFTDTVTDIKHWRYQGDRSFGVAMTNIQSFSEVRSLDASWWPDLEWPGSEILTICAERWINKCAKDGSANEIPAKNLRGGVQTPPGPAHHAD